MRQGDVIDAERDGWWGGLTVFGQVLRDDDAGAVGGFVFDGLQGVVGAVEGEDLDLRVNGDLGGDFEEVESVLAGHVGDAADLALAPEELVVVEGGHLVEVNGVDGDDTAFAEAGERADDDGAAGREGDGSIEFDGRLVGFCSDPGCAERRGLSAMGFAPGGDVDLAAPVAEDSDGLAG